jgi:hypothetical protein
MYIPKWVNLQEAVSHVFAIQGGFREDAQEFLLRAMRDGDIKARDRRSGNPVSPDYWRAPAINPVHLLKSDYTEIEVCTEDLLRCWPEPSHKTAQQERQRPTNEELDQSDQQAPTNSDKQLAYESRVAEFRKTHDGRNPPIQTTKAGVQGDREWAVANGVPRTDISKWRHELLGTQSRGRPQKFGEEFAKKIIRLPI